MTIKCSLYKVVSNFIYQFFLSLRNFEIPYRIHIKCGKILARLNYFKIKFGDLCFYIKILQYVHSSLSLREITKIYLSEILDTLRDGWRDFGKWIPSYYLPFSQHFHGTKNNSNGGAPFSEMRH